MTAKLLGTVGLCVHGEEDPAASLSYTHLSLSPGAQTSDRGPSRERGLMVPDS